MRFANAAAVGIAGFINVAKILSTKESTSSGGGGASGGRGGGASAPSFNLVAGTGSNQVAQSLQSTNEPVKAFVVS